MPTVLGLEEQQWGWRVESRELEVGEVVQLAKHLVELVGMTLDGPPDCTYYPNREGKGGYGIQLYQKLVESFVVISTWPDHGFLRITLASCMPYDPDRVSGYLEERVGRVLMEGGCRI